MLSYKSGGLGRRRAFRAGGVQIRRKTAATDRVKAQNGTAKLNVKGTRVAHSYCPRTMMVMVMVMVKCSALVRSHLIYLVVGSFGPVPSQVGKLHPLRPCLYM